MKSINMLSVVIVLNKNDSDKLIWLKENTNFNLDTGLQEMIRLRYYEEQKKKEQQKKNDMIL